MDLAEPIAASWKAHLALGFERIKQKTVLSSKRFDGPLVVQKPLYPEGEEVCHAIVVHPPAGIAGGDELVLQSSISSGGNVLMTTPGAGKWYRSAGPWASQKLRFEVEGSLEWLPQETIVFDGALARMDCEVNLGAEGRYLGWEVLCLGRTGSGEVFGRGKVFTRSSVSREQKPVFHEQGIIDAGGRLMNSPAGLDGRTVCATMVAAAPDIGRGTVAACREVEGVAVTLLPGVLVARHLGDSSEQAKRRFVDLWKILRPAILGRTAVEPRIWRT